MTAYRVVDEHSELENSGVVPHSQLDTLYQQTQWVVVSGSLFVPPTARQLVPGTGISLTDNGPGGTLVVSVDTSYVQRIKWNDVPIEQANGIITTFTLSAPPVPPQSLMLFLNGVLQRQGADSDFVLSDRKSTRLNSSH